MCYYLCPSTISSHLYLPRTHFFLISLPIAHSSSLHHPTPCIICPQNVSLALKPLLFLFRSRSRPLARLTGLTPSSVMDHPFRASNIIIRPSGGTLHRLYDSIAFPLSHSPSHPTHCARPLNRPRITDYGYVTPHSHVALSMSLHLHTLESCIAYAHILSIASLSTVESLSALDCMLPLPGRLCIAVAIAASPSRIAIERQYHNVYLSRVPARRR